MWLATTAKSKYFSTEDANPNHYTPSTTNITTADAKCPAHYTYKATTTNKIGCTTTQTMRKYKHLQKKSDEFGKRGKKMWKCNLDEPYQEVIRGLEKQIAKICTPDYLPRITPWELDKLLKRNYIIEIIRLLKKVA